MIMIKEIIVRFYCPMDDYKILHSKSYDSWKTREEIANDLEYCYGKIMIVDYEEIFDF